MSRRTVVIGNSRQTGQTLWPKTAQPGLFSKAEAERIVAERMKDEERIYAHSYMGKTHWHACDIHEALQYVSGKAYASIERLLDSFEDEHDDDW